MPLQQVGRRRLAAAGVVASLGLVAVGAGARGAAPHGSARDARAGIAVIGVLILIAVGSQAVTRATRAYLRALVIVAAVVVGLLLAGWALFTGLHLVPGTSRPGDHPGQSPPTVPAAHGDLHLHLSVPVVAIAATVAALLTAAAVALFASHRRRARAVATPKPDAVIYAALEAGDIALRDVEDPREAIIACYAAMEGVLAHVGIRRLVAETPSELLARTAVRHVAPEAAARLTELFLEARYSRHRLTSAARSEAQQALSRLRAAARADQEPARETPEEQLGRSR